MVREINPFQVSGPVRPEDMIDRDGEAENLFALADGGHSARLVAPRRYGKTTLLGRVLRQAGEVGLPTALVDLHGVLTMGAIVVRIERAYAARLKGPIRRAADALLRSWNVGLSLGGGGFTALLQSNPKVDAESVLLRLLDLPTKLAEKTGKRSVIAFDEIQDLLRVEGADGVIRSVIQHQVEALDDAGVYIDEQFQRTDRDPGDALTPLVSFARGHPQRTMLLAHHLWEITPRGSTADETAWIDALERAYGSAVPVLRARWEGLPVNEQRLALALASGRGSIYEEAVLATVGLKRGSVDKALAGLEGRGEVMRQAGGGPELSDPFLDRWLEERGTL